MAEPMTMVAGRQWLVPVLLDPDADRDQWVESRLAGIGGSDASAVVHEHPTKTAIDVWLERRTGASDFQDNDRTVVGRMLESSVLRWFENGGEEWPRSGAPFVIGKPPTVYHRDRPWQRGSADGLIYEPEQVATIAPPNSVMRTIIDTRSKSRDMQLCLSPLVPVAGVEIKTHGWFASRAYEFTEEGAPVSVPPDKRIQVAWYQELYDLDVFYLVALVDTHLRKTYVIERDRDLGATLLEECERFWRVNVVGGAQPEPDGSESYKAYLRTRFAKHNAELVASTPEIDAAATRLLEVKRAQKAAEDEREKLEQVIKSFIGESAGVKTALGSITWKSQASGKLRDKEARAELYTALGWTDTEIRLFEKRFAQPDHRVMRTPK